MAVTIDGLVTGIDTAGIIEGLLKIQKQQVDRFTLRKAEIQEKQSAFKGVETRLLSLRLDISRLSRSQSSPFTRQSVTVSNEAAVSATAIESAAAGIYRFTVDATAKSHQVATQGFAEPDSEITQGTLEIRAGSGTARTITIDASNNTLEGLVDAINAAGAGVAASLIKDSSGGAAPYRLLLTSANSGVANVISVTNGLTTSAGTAVQPELDFGTPVQAASDAQITFGSGAGAISTTSSTNRFDNVFRGVSFNLLQVTAGEEITLTVDRNVQGAVADVQSFISSFNDVIQYIDDQSRYIADSDQGGPLQSHRSVQTIQQKLRSAVLDVVPGAATSVNRLSSIGITVTDSGRLQLNTTRLEDALTGRIEGITATDVKRLFALDGRSDHPGVSFVLGTQQTRASAEPVQVDITQAAKRASLHADSSLAETTVIDASNRELLIKLDGTSATVQLTEGSYTRQELADHLESILNRSADLNGRKVSVGLSSNRLQIVSDRYGANSGVEIVSGSALADLGLLAGQTAAGQDVAGSFVVNGQSEAATGRGRMLSGNAGNDNTDGLQLQIGLSESGVVVGAEAAVTITRGIGATLGNLLDEILSSDNGLASSANEGFRSQLEDIQLTIERQQSVFDRQQAQLIRQFTALETAISQLQSTSNFVASQLAGLIRQ